MSIQHNDLNNIFNVKIAHLETIVETQIKDKL